MVLDNMLTLATNFQIKFYNICCFLHNLWYSSRQNFNIRVSLKWHSSLIKIEMIPQQIVAIRRTKPIFKWWEISFCLYFEYNFMITDTSTRCQSVKWIIEKYTTLNFNTWRPRQMTVILQTISSKAFCWMKMYGFRLKFHWSLFMRVQFKIFQLQITALNRQGQKPVSGQMLV